MSKASTTQKFIKVATTSVLVASTFSSVAAPATAVQFTDIDNSSHKESILALAKEGIIKGYADGSFKPNTAITRGQAAKIIATVLKLNVKDIENPNFTDVKETHEFYPYIAALTEADIISGYKDGTFKQHNTITRGQMSKMLAIGFKLTAANEHHFTDVSQKSEYASHIAALYEHKITTGTSDITFSPRKHVTRGQLATFVARASKTIQLPTQNETITGEVSLVNGDELTIEGKKYSSTSEIATAIQANRDAFTNAKVKLIVNGSYIISVEALELSNNADTFNGKGLVLQNLSVPASVQTLENVTADAVYYEASQHKLVVNKVKAKKFYVNKEPIVLATIANSTVSPPNSNVTFNGSSIEALYIETNIATVSKTNSTINHIFATNTGDLTLNGDFESVTIAANTKINGSAKINSLYITEHPNNLVIANGITITEVMYNDRVYTWNDFKEQFSIEQSPTTEEDSNSDSELNTGENNDSNEGSSPGGSTGSNDTDDNKPVPGDVGNIVIDTENNQVTVGNTTTTVTNEQLQLITDLKENIVDLTFSENGIEALSVKVDTFDGTLLQNEKIAHLTIEAQHISNVKNVKSLTITGAVSTISNTNVEQLNIQTNTSSIDLDNVKGAVVASGNLVEVTGNVIGSIQVNSSAENVLVNVLTTTLDLGNTSGAIKVVGEFNEVTGGQAKTLEIIPTNNVVFNNVGSDEIIISEQPLARAFAGLGTFSTFASTSTMTVAFTGDYEGRTLTVNRTDTIVDVQSPNPFSKITIAGQNNILESNTTLMNVTVSGKATNITLNAFVKDFTIDLKNPIVLSSSVETTTEKPFVIENLTINKNVTVDVTGWISLVNVTINAITYNGTDVTVFENTQSSTFESTVTEGGLMSMGQFTLSVPSTISFNGTDINKSDIKFYTFNNKDAAKLPELLTKTDPQAFAEVFTGNKIFVDNDVKQIIVYAVNASGDIATSVVDVTNFAPFKLLTGDKYATFYTRYDTTKTVKESFDYLLIYKNGELILNETNFTNMSFDANRAIKFSTTANLNGTNEVFISKNYILFRADIKNNSSFFPQMIVETAKIASEKDNPEMLRLLLTYFAKENNTTIDSLFLSDYVDAIAKDPDKFKTAQSLLNLVTELTPKYQLNIQLGAEELLMPSTPLADSASYSVPNIVKVQGSESAGKIMFQPVGVGTTTVRVTDGSGVATLINVTVTESDGKLVIADGDYSIVKAETQTGTLLDGVNNFRLATSGSTTYLVPTKLAPSFALIQLQSGIYNGFAFSNSTTGYTLSTKREITPVEIPIANLGLLHLEDAVSQNIGVLWNSANSKVILFPRAASKETILLADAQNITAVNIDATETGLTHTIAKSTDTLHIQDDLDLSSITKTTMYPQGSLNVHYTNQDAKIQFYGNAVTNVSYVFEDAENDKTIVNVNVTATGVNGPLVVENGHVLKETFTDSNVSVTNITGASVRHSGATIYATQAGKSTVTLSNGKQYLFEVKQSNNQFTMTSEEIENVVIDANTVHMTDITKATSSNSNDTLQIVGGKVIVNLASNDTSMITLKSSKEPAETTVLYVKKTAAGYEFTPETDIVRTVLEPSELGLDTVTNAVGDDSPNARIKIANGKVYVYGFHEGSRLFRVNDGTNNTAINTTVADVNGKLSVTAEPIKHTLTTTTGGNVQSEAVRLKNGVLYATGLGFDLLGKALVEVPIAHDSVQAFYTIGLSQHPDTKLIAFDAQATTTYKQSIAKADLDLSTLYSPTIAAIGTSDTANIKATVNGDNLLITVTGDSEARIQVNESNTSDAKAFIYVKRDGTTFTSHIEKSDTTLSLTDFGYTQTPTAAFSKAQIARAHVDANMDVDFYGLAVGQTSYKVTDGQNKHLFVNIDVTGTTKRTVTTNVVQEATTGEVTIIEGDAVRLSANKDALYANKLNTTSIVKMADGSYIEYKVIENAKGQYELEKTELTKAATISKSTLGLTGDVTVTGLNGAIASYSVTENDIIIYGSSNGHSSMTISDGTRSAVANVEVSATGVHITGPITTSVASTPTMIDAGDANFIRIDGTTIYALQPGVVELLIGNTVQQIAVKKENDTFTISNAQTISQSVFTATDLGFATNDSMSIETVSDTANFSVTQVDNKIVAYSKLSNTATGMTEFIVNASGNRTLVNVKDPGEALLEHTIAKKSNAFTGTTISVANESVAREKNGTLYLLKEGHTHAVVDNYLQAIDVTRENGLLKATVTPLTLTGTFKKLTETNSNILDISADGTTLSAKAIGETTVKDGEQIYKIEITDTNGKLAITKTAISSKTLLATDAQLTDIATAIVLHGDNDAITLSILDKDNTKNGLAIYSNATTAQNVAVLVTDSNGHKAIIDVTIDETGKITAANFVKQQKTVATSTDTAEVQQVTNARGVWDGTTVTTYPIAEGNAALKFANGLVNVITTKDATNKITATAKVLSHNGFINPLNVVTSGAMLLPTDNGFYPIAEGTALIHADGKVYSITVKKSNDQYTMDMSNGVPFTEIATTKNYDVDASTLKGVAVAKDIDEPKLIIYKEGTVTGTSDLVISDATNATVYHVKAEANTVHTPVESKAELDVEFKDAEIKVGNSVRVEEDTLYYLAEQASTLQKDGRLITVDVVRDANGYFTAEPKFVKNTVTVAPADLTNYDIDGTTIYAKSIDVANATETKLISDPNDSTGTKAYYTTFKTVQTGNIFAVDINERKAYQYDVATYDLSTAVTTENNTNANVAAAKIIGNKLVIIAGDAVGSTVITLKDDQNKQLIINATRDADGAFNVYPQAAVDSLKFADIDLNTSTHAITATDYKTDIISVKATSTGLNITAKKAGTTSLQLVQNGSVVGLVNVTVELVNGNLTVTSKPITYTSSSTTLYTNSASRVDTAEATKYYATAVGQTLYKTNNGAQYVNVIKNAADQYTVSKTDHTLAEFNKSELGLSTISTAVSATAAVGTLIAANNNTVYVIGQNVGTTDIVVSDGTSNAIIVAINGTSITAKVARKELPVAGGWTSKAPIIATVRDGYIYSQEAGATVLQTTLNGHKALMNVVVTRNENHTFNIQPEIVSVTTSDWSSVEVLAGNDSVIADGKTLYALQAGTATVKITDALAAKIYTVTVTENANGTFKIALSQPMTHVTFTAAELGLDSLTAPTVNSINGAGVVSAQITNNELVVLAKTSGQAEVTVNDGQTVIHLLVKDVAGELKVEPYISKTTIAGATSITKSKGADDIVRFKDSTIYALKEGKLIAQLNNGELYNIVVTKENNKLVPQATRIEYEFTGANTITTSNKGIVAVDGSSKIVANNYGSETVTVDGKTYKVTVHEDGSIDAILFAENSFDFKQSELASIFTTITEATSMSGITTTSIDSTTVSITPKDSVTAAATDIVTVTNGTQTVQLKVTIEPVTGGFAVTSIELVSKTLNAGELNGVYAQSILTTNGNTPFTSPHGVLKAENGMLTVYPGLAGEVHFIVSDSEQKQTFFVLQSTPANAGQSFTIKPLTQRIENNAFGYSPIVLATNGKARTTVDGSALNVTFGDTNETVFVTSSGENLYHTVLTQATANDNLFELANAVVQEALVINGDITNVTPKLHSISQNGKTILYATSETPTTAYFTGPNGIINKVTVGNNYALTNKFVVSENTYNYTDFEFLAETGNDVVSLLGDKLAVKSVGTGIYKTNSDDYVQVTVTGDPATGYSVATAVLPKKDLASFGTNLDILAPTIGVYLDGTTIYGNTSEIVAVSNGEAIYTDTAGFNNLKRLELDLLDKLGWSHFKSHTLADDSQFATIDSATFIPKTLNANGEVITFTAPSGIQKQVKIKVKDDFTIEAIAGQEEISYQFVSSNVNMQLSFSINIDPGFELLTNTNGSLATFAGSNQLYLETANNTQYTGTFNLHFPEKKGGHAFTVSSSKTEHGWQIPTIDSDNVKFNLIP